MSNRLFFQCKPQYSVIHDITKMAPFSMCVKVLGLFVSFRWCEVRVWVCVRGRAGRK